MFTLAAAAALGSATAAGGAGGEAYDKAPTELALVKLEPMAVPIVDGDHVQGELRVHLYLSAKDAASAGEMGPQMPRLRAATFATMMDFARLYASPYRAVDSAQLAKELTAALRKENPGVYEVLITAVAAKPV